MTVRRIAALMIGLSLLLIVAPTTGGTSTTAAERSVSIQTVDDRRALLGLQSNSRRLHAGRNRDVAILTVVNRFPGRIEHVSVEASTNGAGSGLAITGIDPPTSLAPGESGRVTATVVCPPGAEDAVALEIEASSPAVAVRLSRQVTITCARPTNSSSPGEGSRNPAN